MAKQNAVNAGLQMISVEEALEQILALVRPLPLEETPILEALDRVLGEDVRAEENIPPFINSAMDGYAVRARDTDGASRQQPARLRVIGEIAAGQAPDLIVTPGTAARIMTGAPMPAGADAVVRFEDTDEADGQAGAEQDIVAIYAPAKLQLNVRLAGEDVRDGELVLPAGTLLRPQEIGVLASLGRPLVKVPRRPRVAVLATGDELLEISQSLRPGKIRNSNEYTNTALVTRYGGIPLRLGIARDTLDDLTSKLQAGLEQGANMFVTSAGVSVGDFDVVKEALDRMGKINFWQVRMKPGKPLAFGTIEGVPLVGLPGNPVSAMVSFEQFVRPAMRVMQRRRSWRKQTVEAIVDEDIENRGRRRHFVRAIVTQGEDGRYRARTTGEQGSGILTSMVHANALLIIPEDVTLLRKGEAAVAQMLDWPEV